MYNSDPSSHNLYAYCTNNPVTYTDPSGHFPVAAVIGAAWGAYDGYKYAKKKKLTGWRKAGAIAGGAALGVVNPFKKVGKAYKAAKRVSRVTRKARVSKTVAKSIKKVVKPSRIKRQAKRYSISGYLLQNEHGTVGNIMQINEQGKQVIAGRMRFKPVDGLPVSNATTTVVPFDPTMMVVAVALMTIEKKLDGIQASIDKVLKFLENDKQARQRGNLNTLSEIAEDYKRKGNDQAFCENRNHIVQEIQRDARHNIEFYKRKLSEAVKDKKLIHLSKDAHAYMESIKRDFAEYQLACYSYAYCAFLDTVLRKDFDEASIDSCRNKIERIAGRYNKLFAECHSQIASYQRSSVENKVLGGIGKTANTLGKAIGNIPVIEKSPVDELLLDAGNALRGVNKNAVKSRVKALESLEDNRMGCFLEGVDIVGLLYNQKNRMITEGTHIYVV